MREELRRLLAGRQKHDIRADGCKPSPVGSHFAKPHLRRHVGIGAFERFHGSTIERLLLAVSSGLNLIGRDSLLDEVLLDSLDAAFA